MRQRVLSDDEAYTPTVAVRTRRLGAWVEIRVADNGVGVPHDLRDRIFEPFFSTKPTGTGSGLGLSLAYQVVTEGHGGALELADDEAESRGATFVVTLPYVTPL